MKLVRTITLFPILVGGGLLTSLAIPVAAHAAEKTARSLEKWTYIHADSDRIPTSKKRGSFGIGFGDVNGDRFMDIASGSYFYRNPGGNLTQVPWPRVTLPASPATGNPVDAGLLFDATNKGALRDILAEDLPNVVWLHSGDAQGSAWSAKVVAQMPAPNHANGRIMRLARITPGYVRPEILLSGQGGTFLLQVPANPEAEPWPMRKITTTDSDEQKSIGLADIDGDGLIDLVLPAGAKRVEIEWWRNPGSGTGFWEKQLIGRTVQMAKMIEVADVNGDGRMDVVATDSENVNSGVFWFEAPASPEGEWVRHTVVQGYNGLDSLSVADMNQDGRVDIIVGETKGKLRLAIYENLGAGATWREHVITEGKESHKGANVVDLDDDGDLDIVSIAFFAFKDLHVWRNDNGVRTSKN